MDERKWKNLLQYFEPGKRLRRTDLHSESHGQVSGNLITPKDWPYIFVILDRRQDKRTWEKGDIVHVFGERTSQKTPWAVRNNAVRYHKENGKKLIVWKALGGRKTGFIECLGEYRYITFEIGKKPIGKGKIENAIRFTLAPSGPVETIITAAQYAEDLERATAETNTEISRIGPTNVASKIYGGQPQQLVATVTLYKRDPNVITLVLYRARGHCEGCAQKAPLRKIRRPTVP